MVPQETGCECEILQDKDDQQTVGLCEQAILIKLMHSGHTACEIKEKL